MTRPILRTAVAAMLLASSAPLAAGAAGFTLLNASGTALKSVEIRRSPGGGWQPLVPGVDAGARVASKFADPDCAFDIRATGTRLITWSGVNLCGATVVVLKIDPSGSPWVDYD